MKPSPALRIGPRREPFWQTCLWHFLLPVAIAAAGTWALLWAIVALRAVG